MMRWRCAWLRRALVLACGAVGCGDDGVQPGHGSSGDETGSSTAGGTQSSDSSGTTGSSTTSESTGGVDSTSSSETGGASAEPVRVIYRLQDSDDPVLPQELWTFDVEDGVAGAPQLVHEPIARGDLFNPLMAYSPDRRHIAYTIRTLATMTMRLFVVDVTDPAFPAPIEVGMPALPMLVTDLRFSPGGDLLAFRATEMQNAPFEIYLADPEGDPIDAVRMSPVVAMGTGTEGLSFSPDGTRLGYAVDLDGSGVSSLVVQDIDLVAPPAPIPLASPASAPRWWSPAGDVIAYADDVDADEISEWFLVGVDGSPGGTHDPGDVGETHTVSFAPDGRGFVYHLGTGLTGDVWMVPIDGTSFGAPVLINEAGPGEAHVKYFDWSPDSSRIAYIATHDGPQESFLVELDGVSPAPAVRVNGDLVPEGEVTNQTFAPDGNALFYFASQDELAIGLYRAVIENGAPMAPVALHPPLEEGAWMSTELLFFDDGNHVLFTGYDLADGPQNLWWVDLSGVAPTAAVQVNPPLGSNGFVRFGAEMTADRALAFYGVRSRSEAPTLLHMTALAEPGAATQLTDAKDVIGIELFELP